MAEKLFTLDMASAVRRAREQLPSAAAAELDSGDLAAPIAAQWKDEDGNAIGSRIGLGEVQRQLVEAPGPSGAMGWSREPADLALSLPTPDEAYALDVFIA